MHRDVNNAHIPNVIHRLTDFGGGELWVEDPEGPHEHRQGGRAFRGRMLPIAPFVAFSAKKLYHAVQAWQGRRVVVVQYTVASFLNITTHNVSQLLAMGFRMPTREEEARAKDSVWRGSASRQRALEEVTSRYAMWQFSSSTAAVETVAVEDSPPEEAPEEAMPGYITMLLAEQQSDTAPTQLDAFSSDDNTRT